MTPLLIASVLVQGEYPYTPEYVRRLFVMCQRYVKRSFAFCCLTDQPMAMPDGVMPIQVHRLEGCFAFWTKLQLFHVLQYWGGRILYIDLDSVIVNSLDAIIDYPASLALTEDAQPSAATDRYGRQIVKRFNSSVMAWDGGTHTDLWDLWTLSDAQRLSTDQDWIAERALDAAQMPASWFPRASVVSPPWTSDAKVVLAKKPKGFEACAKWPWFNEAWGGWAA
jgi:hypothetical protein